MTNLHSRLVAHLKGKTAIKPLEVVFWLAILGAYVLLPQRHLILNEMAILALFALSLDILLGYAGVVSLGHAAFLGLGAYTAGLIAKHFGGEPVLALLASMGTAALLGALISPLILRGADLTRLMVTLGIAMVMGEIANKAAWLTGGADGLQGMVVNPLLGLFEFDLFGSTACAYSLIVFFLLFVIARFVVNSPFGYSLTAIRDNRLRATMLGVPVSARLVAAVALSAAYAGAAGALLAQTTQFVSIDVLEFHRSADVMMVLIIGGTGYLYGGPVGAVIFTLLKDRISAFTPEYWHFWIGLLLVAMVLIGRERITGGVGRLVQRLSPKGAR